MKKIKTIDNIEKCEFKHKIPFSSFYEKYINSFPFSFIYILTFGNFNSTQNENDRKLLEIVNWLRNNIKGKWCWELKSDMILVNDEFTDLDHNVYINVDRKQDAMLLKLTWQGIKQYERK